MKTKTMFVDLPLPEIKAYAIAKYIEMAKSKAFDKVTFCFGGMGTTVSFSILL